MLIVVMDVKTLKEKITAIVFGISRDMHLQRQPCASGKPSYVVDAHCSLTIEAAIPAGLEATTPTTSVVMGSSLVNI